MNFQVNDVVDVIDLRDHSIVKRRARILTLESCQMPGMSEPSWYASLDAGYAVSVKCLRYSDND